MPVENVETELVLAADHRVDLARANPDPSAQSGSVDAELSRSVVASLHALPVRISVCAVVARRAALATQPGCSLQFPWNRLQGTIIGSIQVPSSSLNSNATGVSLCGVHHFSS